MKSPADRGRINSDEFVTMFQEMATRPEIYFLLIRFANRDYFTADDFLHFLECEQAVILFVWIIFFQFVSSTIRTDVVIFIIFRRWGGNKNSLHSFYIRIICIDSILFSRIVLQRVIVFLGDLFL